MINDLTNGMIRLSADISALRHNRAVLTCDLRNTVSEMIAGFQQNREEMGETTKAALSEARTNLEKTISGMIAGFQRDREEMGEKTKAELNEFVADLRHKVVGLRAEFANDIKGAHAAWSHSATEQNPSESSSEKPYEAPVKNERKKR